MYIRLLLRCAEMNNVKYTIAYKILDTVRGLLNPVIGFEKGRETESYLSVFVMPN